MKKLLAAMFVALLMAGCGDIGEGLGEIIGAIILGVFLLIGLICAPFVLIGGIAGGRAASKRKKGFWKGFWKGIFVGSEAALLVFINLIGRLDSLMGSSFSIESFAVVVLIGGIVGGIVASKRKKEVWKGVFTGLRFLLLPLGVTVAPAIVLPYLVYLPFYFWGKSNHTAGGKVVWNAQGGVDANREEGNFTAYVSKDGQQYGPYTVEQLREYVQQGNFTTGDHACHDGQNWVTIAQVPGFADAGDSVTTPQQDQVVQEHAVEQQPASANASSSPAKKRKIILWTGIALVATLLVVGLLVWLLGGDEGVPESNQSPAEPTDAKPAQVGKIDLNDPKTRKKIIAKAVKHPSKMNLLQNRGKKGEELLYRKNQPKPYTGWSKWMGGNGRIRNLIHRKDGKQNGLAVWFYKNNGQKEGELNYKDGKPDGLWTEWYEDGQKEEERTYKDGEVDGLGTEWYENGQKKTEGNWENDQRNGLSTGWYENGQKAVEANLKDGKLMSVMVWKSDGEKCPVTNVKDGDGVGVDYESDGTEKYRWTLKDGERVVD